jgi:hypothetical protein
MSAFRYLFPVYATISFDVANTDFAINIPRRFTTAKYQVTAATMFLNAAIGIGNPTFGLFSAAGGGGLTLVTNATMPSLIAADTIQALTLAASASSKTLSGAQLFGRVGTAGLNLATLELLIGEIG